MFLINSPATYLHAFGEVPYTATAIDLNANGFYAGQTVTLKRAGAYQNAPFSSLKYGLSAVFSTSSTLLPSNMLNRVAGAVSAGPTWTSLNTFIGNQPTDIADDFQVDNMTGTANGITLVIPAGALYLFASAQDDFWQDNNNAPEFYISMEEPVPEPATLSALGLGVLAGLRRRRS